MKFLVVQLDMERLDMELMSNLLKSHGLEQLPDNPTSRRIVVQGDEKMAEWVAKTSKSLGLVNSNQEPR